MGDDDVVEGMVAAPEAGETDLDDHGGNWREMGEVLAIDDAGKVTVEAVAWRWWIISTRERSLGFAVPANSSAWMGPPSFPQTLDEWGGAVLRGDQFYGVELTTTSTLSSFCITCIITCMIGPCV